MEENLNSDSLRKCAVSKAKNGKKDTKRQNGTDPSFENLLNLLVANNILEQNCDIYKLTSLDLSNCSLLNIPSALKDLPLKNLNLSHNKLNEIPTCLYIGLSKVEILNLSDNALAKFENEPSCCTNLRTLDISNNILKNVPPWILNLRATNLEEFNYSFNKVTFLRCIFDNTLYFPVRKMSMINCILRQEDCKFLKNCTNLEVLDISNSKSLVLMNMFTNIDELFVQPTWKNLSILKLENLSLSIFPEGITWLETLTELYLSNNDFMWLPKDGLEYFVNLEILDLSNNSLYSLPDKLTWLIHLRILKLNNNNIEELPDFSTMKSLQTLDLYHNKLFNFKCNMKKTDLNDIDLEYNYFNTEECDMLNYEKMRDELRKLLEENRITGCRIIENLVVSEESSYDSEENGEELECASEISENWDEEIQVIAKEDISPSDDEWLGFEEVNVCQKIDQLVLHSNTTYNEDVIFCDAD